jgi:hypothetical protein
VKLVIDLLATPNINNLSTALKIPHVVKHYPVGRRSGEYMYLHKLKQAHRLFHRLAL